MSDVNSETLWDYRSANLRKVQDTDVAKKSKKKISNRYKDNSSLQRLSNTSNIKADVKQFVYPVLPNTPPSYPSEKIEQWNNRNDLFSETASQSTVSMKRPQTFDWNVERVIDNKQYSKHWNTQSFKSSKSDSNSVISKSTAVSKQYILKHLNKEKNYLSTKKETNLMGFHAAQKVTLEVIDECLEDELIPDILIEVLREIENDQVEINKTKEILIRSTAEDILVEVVDEYIYDIVLSMVLRNTKSQLQSQIISKWVIDEALVDFLNDIAQESVTDVVNEYLAITRAENAFNDLVDNTIQEVIQDMKEDVYSELFLEDVLDSCVVIETVNELTKEICGAELEYYRHKVSRINLHQISSRAVELPLGGLIADHLAGIGSRHRSIYAPNKISQFLFERMAFDILLQQIHQIRENVNDTIENKPICQWHQRINTSLAASLILKNLKQHSNADLCDLDESEVTGLGIKRYISDIEESVYLPLKQ